MLQKRRGENSPFLDSKIKEKLKEEERARRKGKVNLLWALANGVLGWRMCAQEKYARQRGSLRKRRCKK